MSSDFFYIFSSNIRSTIKELQSQGKCKCFEIKKNFELFLNISLAHWTFQLCQLFSKLQPFSLSVVTLTKLDKIFSQGRNTKFCQGD